MAALQPRVGGLPHPHPHPPFSDRSFASTLKQPPPINQVPETPSALGTHKGCPAIFITDSRWDSLAKPFAWTLVGKFSRGYNKKSPDQGRPSVEQLHTYFQTLDLKADFSLGLLDNRHLLINLRSEEDYLRLYSRTVWRVAAVTMRTFKWTPDFHVEKESSLVPVWITFPRLPIHLFSKSILVQIGSLIGLPLRLDAATVSLKRPSMARLQVELDLLEERPNQIWIGVGDCGGFWQKVEYENLPFYCQQCWHVGHEERFCRFASKPQLREHNERVTDPSRQQWVIKATKSVAESQQQATHVSKNAESSGGNPQAAMVVAPPVSQVAPTAAVVCHQEAPLVHQEEPVFPVVVDVSPSSEEDQSLVILEDNRFAGLAEVEGHPNIAGSNADGQVAGVPSNAEGQVAVQSGDNVGHSTPISIAASTREVPVARVFQTFKDIMKLPQGPQTGTSQSSHALPNSSFFHAAAAQQDISAARLVSSNPLPKTKTQDIIVSSTPLSLEAASWYPRGRGHLQFGQPNTRILPPSFDNIAVSSHFQQYNDDDLGSDEVDVDSCADSYEDFEDSLTTRDDTYLEKRKLRRGRGRPLGSKNRTYYDLERTISTRSRTID